MFTLILFAAALASDAFAVALARGTCHGHDWKRTISVAVAFSSFQAIAAIIGGSIGDVFGETFKSCETYFSVGALVLLGALMIKNAIQHKDDAEVCEVPESPVIALLGLVGAALAVSLDCLAAGVALPLLGYSIWIDAGVILVVSFVLSTVGYKIGAHAGSHLEQKAEIAGGLVLIGLGLHLLA